MEEVEDMEEMEEDEEWAIFTDLQGRVHIQPLT